MGYNSKFQLNPEQMELIENALRAEIGRLAKPTVKNWNETCPKKETAKELRELLGHLHNQKRWFTPKKHVPQG